MRLTIACHSHLEGRFTWPTTEDKDSAAVLRCNAISQGQTQAGALLLPLTNKRLEEAFTNLLRNTSIVVDNVHDNLPFTRFQGIQGMGSIGIVANGLAYVEKQFEDRTLNPVLIDDDSGLCGIAALSYDLDPTCARRLLRMINKHRQVAMLVTTAIPKT
ncbi:MAG: hypothetical protein WBE41_20570 [Terracidiphilus sp.]